jgi:hypothetical protein
MARFGFVGPSYSSQSPAADDERCLNWYVERLEAAGKSVYALYPTPGLVVNYTAFAAGGGLLPGKSVRGIAVANNLGVVTISGGLFGPSRAVMVSGNTLYELSIGGFQAFHGVALGPLANDELPVSMAFGPTQVLIASGGNVYVYNLTTLAFTQVAQSNFNSLPVSQVAYCDGFFLALNALSSQWYASALLDATTWPGTSTAKVSVFPNNVIAMIVNQRQVWMLGSENSVVYYNSGNSPFPFDVIQGSLMEQGCSAVFSAAKMDNSIFWLGGDSRGQAMVWRANGYTPQRVSNHAVEFAMQRYPKVSDAVAYTYQDQGHSFYQIYFPSANNGLGATWVYDAATGLWHEKAFLNADGTFSAHRSWNHAFIQQTNQHLVGDWNAPNVYHMGIPGSPNNIGNADFTTDQVIAFSSIVSPIQRLRRSPHINLEKEWVFHHEMQVDLEAGLGPIPPLLDGSGNARDPQLMLRWSDDGGRTWSNQYFVGVGQAGNYKTRAVWRRLGRSRQRIYEVSCSDPIPWRIVDAYLKATPAYQAEERLVSKYAKMA